MLNLLGSYSGINIYSSELLPPDFFLIRDWDRPRATATPQWLNIWMIEGRAFAHPSVIDELKRKA